MKTKWIDIFTTGRHRDHSGQPREWTKADLNRMVSGFDPATRRVPLVIGHPRLDDPAWGWASAVRRQGSTLQAAFGDVDPAVAVSTTRP